MINLSVIKDISRIKKCSIGTVITEGKVGPIMFVVLKGDISVFTNDKPLCRQLISTLGTGDFFVDPGLMQEKKATYITVATSEAIIMPVDNRNKLEFIQNEPAMVLEMLKELSLGCGSALMPNQAPGVVPQNTQPLPNSPVDTPQPVPEAITEDPTRTENAAEPEPAILSPSPAEPTAPVQFDLFPKNHGNYQLTLNEPGSPYLLTKTHTCPICKNTFTAPMVRSSKLIVTATDKDLRYHYKGIEPLYYEVLTCPHCLYSALPDVFNTPDKSKVDIENGLKRLQQSVGIDFSGEKTTITVFAGFHLALYCAPLCFVNNQLLMGRLLYKLSRVYHDAGDESLENETAMQALEHFLYTYGHTETTPNQEQQICVTIGELYMKQNDYRNAISFFSKAKANSSSPVLKSHADSRVYDIRSLVSQQNS